MTRPYFFPPRLKVLAGPKRFICKSSKGLAMEHNF